MSSEFVLPAKRGIAVQLDKAQTVRITNIRGSQVVDTWAFNASETSEFMSMEHTRASLKKLTPCCGESLVTNKRRPILTLLSDSSPGIHDTLIAACDRYRYELLGHIGYHDNCTDNLAAAMQAIGMVVPETPCPLNLFMNIPVIQGSRLDWRPPASKAGDHVTLRAEMAAIVVFSACPMDLLPVNGVDCTPSDIAVSID
ncbi:urea carboxylase-associated family protein [Bradyrhizobium sp. SSUT77]|uniref:urea carboxylase-associated family protein n=1 Tax=Bradyrhizobium sp. SSUT77 TaxID=3040603 RepID=UPI002448CB14|nr:urea carboxylase-associated family protein [Bradyrhizobium sp. SSUT77]MDH2348323.1 urea carboxylase-associated family protein [Bradyrhizobium sp. SSUT77]